MNGKTKWILFLVGALLTVYSVILQQSWASIGENREDIKHNASKFEEICERLARIETKIDVWKCK